MSLLGFILFAVASCVGVWIVQTVSSPSPVAVEEHGDGPE